MNQVFVLLSVVTGVLGIAWLASVLLRSRTAERDLVWRTALLTVAVAPLLVLGQAHLAPWQWSVALLPAPDLGQTEPVVPADRPFGARDSQPVDGSRDAGSLAARHSTNSTERAETDTPRTPRDEAPNPQVGNDVAASRDEIAAAPSRFGVGDAMWLIPIVLWGIVAAFRLARLAGGLRKTGRLVALSQPVLDEGVLAAAARAAQRTELPRPPAIVVSHDASGPLVVGVLHPHVLVPAALLAADARTHLQVALLHECAHIRRRDLAFELVQQLVAAGYWFHPLVHVMNRALWRLREDLCDNHVLGAESAVIYAETLLELSLERRSRQTALVAVGMIDPHRPLEHRIRSLLASGRSTATRASRPAGWSTFVAALLLALAVMLVRLDHAQVSQAAARVGEDLKEAVAASEGAASRITKPVTGTVVDAEGGPVAGADVYLLANPRNGSFTLPTHPAKTRTDAAGGFEFREVAEGNYRVWGETGNRISHAKELTGERVAIGADTVPSAITLKLFEGCRFDVTVRAKSDGRPIPGAVVRFRWPDIERSFRTNAEGITRIEGVRPEDHVFEARAEGYAVEVKTVAATKLDSLTALELTLGPGGTIRGTVRESGGKAIAGERIGGTVQRSPADLHIGTVQTDDDGRFVLENAPLEELVELRIFPVGFLEAKRTVVLTAREPSAAVVLLLQRREHGGSIVVEVVDPDGKPVAGAKLVNPGGRSDIHGHGTTDASGTFLLEDVFDTLGRHELNVKAKGFAPKRTNFKPGSAAEPSRVRVQLERGHSIRGRVLLSDGKPAAKVPVYYNEGEHGNELGGGVATDEEGRFEVDSLPAGCVFTVYSPKGHAPYSKHQLPLDGPDEVVVNLIPEGIVSGRVVDDATGKALVPFRVRVMHSSQRQAGDPSFGLAARPGQEGLVITAPEGGFRFGGYLQGFPLQLVLSSEGYDDVTMPRVLARPEKDFAPLEVRLKKSDPTKFRQVSGRLIDHQGQPVAKAQIRLWTASARPDRLGEFPSNWIMIQSGQLADQPPCRQFVTATTDDAGRFTLTGICSEQFAEVAWWGTGIAPGRQVVAIDKADGGKVSLELKAAAPAELEIVIDRTAWPTAGHVLVHGSRATLGHEQWTMREGETQRRFENLPAGEVWVVLSTPFRRVGASNLDSETLGQKQVTLKPGEKTTVKFEAAK